MIVRPGADFFGDVLRFYDMIRARGAVVTKVRISQATFDMLAPKDADGKPLPLSGAAHLGGVPVVVDDNLPAGIWEADWTT